MHTLSDDIAGGRGQPDVGKHGSFSSRWEMPESPVTHANTGRGDVLPVSHQGKRQG